MKQTVHEFYMQMLNLAHIKRYSVVPRIHDESIAEHSFFVASIVLKLADDYEFDVGPAIGMAIVHDWTESYTDDITVLTKRKYPEIAKVIEEIEPKIAKEEFSPMVLLLWQEYKAMETPEALIVKYADIIQVIQYAQAEVNMGNREYMQSVVDDAISRGFELEIKLNEFKK
jgi:5'-deoxynucleotidase YfbR-like HD superfamily hydrolase